MGDWKRHTNAAWGASLLGLLGWVGVLLSGASRSGAQETAAALSQWAGPLVEVTRAGDGAEPGFLRGYLLSFEKGALVIRPMDGQQDQTLPAGEVQALRFLPPPLEAKPPQSVPPAVDRPQTPPHPTRHKRPKHGPRGVHEPGSGSPAPAAGDGGPAQGKTKLPKPPPLLPSATDRPVRDARDDPPARPDTPPKAARLIQERIVQAIAPLLGMALLATDEEREHFRKFRKKGLFRLTPREREEIRRMQAQTRTAIKGIREQVSKAEAAGDLALYLERRRRVLREAKLEREAREQLAALFVGYLAQEMPFKDVLKKIPEDVQHMQNVRLRLRLTNSLRSLAEEMPKKGHGNGRPGDAMHPSSRPGQRPIHRFHGRRER